MYNVLMLYVCTSLYISTCTKECVPTGCTTVYISTCTKGLRKLAAHRFTYPHVQKDIQLFFLAYHLKRCNPMRVHGKKEKKSHVHCVNIIVSS